MINETLLNFNSTFIIYRSSLKKNKKIYLLEVVFNFKTFIGF